MATPSLCAAYEQLSKADDWLNGLEIASKAKIGRRMAGVAGLALVDAGIAEIKTVDRRKYFRLLPNHAESGIAADINETLRIKSK